MRNWLRAAYETVFPAKTESHAHFSPAKPGGQIAQWDFPTEGKSFTIELRFIEGKDSKTSFPPAHTFEIRIKGMKHPHAQADYCFASDVLKNPALLPAMYHVTCAMQDEILAAFADNKKLPASHKYPLRDFTPFVDGTFNNIRFSARTPARPESEFMSGREARALFDRFRTKIDALHPEITKLIEKNAFLQPSKNPGVLEVMEFETRAVESWRETAARINHSACGFINGDGLLSGPTG